MSDYRIEHEMMQSYLGQAELAKAEAEAAMHKYDRLMDMAAQHRHLMEVLLETTPAQII